MSGLYIHIPFCASKCAYCDFFSSSSKSQQQFEAYADALINEWNFRKGSISDIVETIYFGGGTPSLMPSSTLDRVIDNIPTSDSIETTLEANPEQLTPDFVEWFNKSKFNRISVGIQSLNDVELNIVGRNHDSSIGRDALQTLRDFSNYSVDIIYGLPGQTLDSLERTIDGVLRFKPPHMSAYMLSYEQGTRLYAMLQSGKVRIQSDETLCQMYELVCTKLRTEGYEHYEISNFAQPGYRAIHNSNYWLDKPYLGLGAGAHSYIGGKRHQNQNNIKSYINGKGIMSALEEAETLDNLINDHIMIALRTSEGINQKRFVAAFGEKQWGDLITRVSRYETSGSIVRNESGFAISEKSWLISDSIIASLFV